MYFITANILLKKVNANEEAAENGGEYDAAEVVEDEEADKAELGKFLYQIEDIIVNPAYTKGDQLLLSSIAFDLGNEESKVKIEQKEILVKDIVISVLSSKTINQLSSNSFKDSLRTEISDSIGNYFGDISINKVYFSKYIIN